MDVTEKSSKLHLNGKILLLCSRIKKPKSEISVNLEKIMEKIESTFND